MRLTIHRSEEEALIKKCREFDRQAQQAIYQKYAAKMFGISLRYVHETADAEDIVICAFVKVFEKMSQFKGDGSFEGWIRRIVVNESLGFIRKNKSMYLAVDIIHAEKEPDYNSLGSHLEAEDLMKLVWQLPIGYRTVFNLYAIEGYSHKEIAKEMGISENTSKSQLSRARNLLQRQLLDSEAMLNKKIQ